MTKFEPISEAAFEKNSERSGKSKLPRATSVRFDRRTHEVTLALSTGLKVSFDPRLAYGLEDATEEELAGVEVEGAGGAIRFPALDADFSVARLLQSFLGPLEWARREARAAASRKNGKLGGRPRRVAEAA